MSPSRPESAAADRLAQFRAEWPARITAAQLRAANPTVYRQAVGGAFLFVAAILVALLWSGLSTEFPIPIALPDWLEWSRGFLIVATVWVALMLGIFGIVLMSMPSDLRRELAFRGFASERGLSCARYGIAPPARGIYFAEAEGIAAAVSARRRSRGEPALPGDPVRFRANFALSGGWQIGEPDLQIAVAAYSGGKNDPRGPRATFRYLLLKTPRQLPNLMIDSLRNGRLRQVLPGVQRITLEGDFDRHFAVYAPVGYARDALEILTPDVMAGLIDYGRHWDIEVVEDRLIVASHRASRRWDRAETTALLLFAEIVGANLAHQASTYTDPRARRPRTQLAEPGRRLRRRSTWWVWIVVCLGIGAMLGYPFVLGWWLDLRG